MSIYSPEEYKNSQHTMVRPHAKKNHSDQKMDAQIVIPIDTTSEII